jgi:hypothetical protein
MVKDNLHLPSERRRVEESGGDYPDQGGRAEQRIGTNGHYSFLPIACRSGGSQTLSRIGVESQISCDAGLLRRE